MVGQWSFGCDQVLPSGDNRSCHNCNVTTSFRFISQFHWLVVTSELFLGIRKFCTYIRASQRSFHTPFCISSTWGLSARENHQNQLVFKIIFLILSWPQSGGPMLAIFRFFSHTQCHSVDHTHTHIYMYLYVCIYIHVSVYVYIYIYIYTYAYYHYIFHHHFSKQNRHFWQTDPDFSWFNLHFAPDIAMNTWEISSVFCFTRQRQGRDAVPPPKPKSCKRSEDTSAWKWRKWDLRGVLLTSTRQPEMLRG